MTIKKGNMAEKAAAGAGKAPDLEQRLKHAQELASQHPVEIVAPVVEAVAQATIPVSVPTESWNESTAGKVYFAAVPIELVDENPYNARKVYRPERVNELATSIGAHGQDVPGIATLRSGRYVLAAGHYRRKAIRLLGLKTMNLMVHENLTDKQLYEYSYRENAERETQSALDNALCWQQLLDKRLFANKTELAEAIGLSLPNIEKTLRILSLPQLALDVVEENPAQFALSALYELALYAAIADENAILDMVQKLKLGDVGRKEIKAARDMIEAPKKPRKSKETSRAYKIQRDGVVLGSIKVWDSGRVMMDAVLPDSGERENILAELKKQFGIES